MPAIQGNYTDVTYKLPPDFRYNDPSGIFSVCWLSKVLKGIFCFQLPEYGSKCTEGETEITEGKEIKLAIELGSEKAKFTYEHVTKTELKRTWKHSRCDICQPSMCLDGTIIICNCESILPWSDAKWQVTQFAPDSPSNGKFWANCTENAQECKCHQTIGRAQGNTTVEPVQQYLEVPCQQFATRVLRPLDFTLLPRDAAHADPPPGEIAQKYSEILEAIAQPIGGGFSCQFYKFGVQDYAGRVSWILNDDTTALLSHLTLLSSSVSRSIEDATVVRGPQYRLPMLAVGPAMSGVTAEVKVESWSPDAHRRIIQSFTAPVSVVTKQLTTLWVVLDLSKLPQGCQGIATIQVTRQDGRCGAAVGEPFIIA